MTEDTSRGGDRHEPEDVFSPDERRRLRDQARLADMWLGRLVAWADHVGDALAYAAGNGHPGRGGQPT